GDRLAHSRGLNVLAQIVDRSNPERLIAVRSHLIAEISQRINKAAQDEQIQIPVGKTESDAHPRIQPFIEQPLRIRTLVLEPSVDLLMDRVAGDLADGEYNQETENRGDER